MGFVQTAAEGAFGITLDRLRRGVDLGQGDPRPELDLAQQRDFLAEQAGGRTDEPYRQCLLYHGFRWYPLPELRKLPGAYGKLEGEWRSTKLRLAFTVQDLTGGFPTGPAKLDEYLRDHRLVVAVSRGRVPKEALTRARRR
jgi:hypothetical protein